MENSPKSVEQSSNGEPSVTHAFVRYLNDNVTKIVPVSDIKKFNPKTLQDLKKNKAYSVWWSYEDSDSDDGNYYKAIIILLGSKYINDTYIYSIFMHLKLP